MLFPIFVAMTLLEIYTLVSVGKSIGGFSTILLVIITALIGSSLLKQQGFSTLAKVQEKAVLGQMPAFEMLEGLVILIAGILLLTPGFITDTFGLLGLIPISRRFLIARFLQKKIHYFNRQTPTQPSKTDSTIEGEFWED
jgi:UPF0716 protein FxsA